jgi:hypothetical protein
VSLGLICDCSLAYCELYVMGVDTEREDLMYDHDLIVVQTKKGSISVKIDIE